MQRRYTTRGEFLNQGYVCTRYGILVSTKIKRASTTRIQLNRSCMSRREYLIKGVDYD